MKKFVAAAMALSLLGTPILADKDKDEANYRKMETALETTVLDTFSFENVDIVDVVKYISKKARINIVFDQNLLGDIGDDERLITIELVDIKAQSALSIVLSEAGLYQSFRHGVVYITTEENAVEATSLKTYDVRDITVKITNFPAPKLRLKPADDSSGDSGLQLPEEDAEPVETDDVVEMIEDTIDADWGGTSSISKIKGQLIITTTRSVHQDIALLLAELRSSK